MNHAGDIKARPGKRLTHRYLFPFKSLLLISWLAIYLIIAPRAVASVPAQHAPNNPFELHMSNEFSVYNHRISGPGHANSVLNEGWHYQEALTANGNGGNEKISYDFNFGAKSTDDDDIDVRRFSLTHASFNLRTPQQTLNMGDTFEFFSQYSLSSALKGGAYRFLGGSNPWIPRISLVYGLAAPRWDSIWGDLPTRTVQRRVYGTRLAFGTTEELGFGFHVVGINDRDPVTGFERVYTDSLVYGLDARYKPLPGLTLFAEAALNSGEAGTANGAQSTAMDGYAAKFRAVGDKDPSRVLIEYERIDPEFENPVGSATADREKIKFMWRYKLIQDLQLDTNMLWYRNNLEDQNVEPRSDHYLPEVALGWSHPFQRHHGYMRLSIGKKIAEQEGNTIKNDDLIYLNYRDRFGIIDTDSNLGYNIYYQEGATAQDSNQILANTVITSRFTTGSLIIKPAVHLGGWRFQNELQDSDDRYHEYSVGLGINLPDANITSNLKFGINELDKEVGEDSSKWFGNLSVYWRPEFLPFFDHNTLFLKGFINDYKFENGANDFREDSIMAGLSFSF